jgi:hypothetical protein
MKIVTGNHVIFLQFELLAFLYPCRSSQMANASKHFLWDGTMVEDACCLFIVTTDTPVLFSSLTKVISFLHWDAS